MTEDSYDEQIELLKVVTREGRLEDLIHLFKNVHKYILKQAIEESVVKAVKFNHLPILQWFITEEIIDPRQFIYSTTGSGILATAVASGNKEIIKWLLENKKVDVDMIDREGNTALYDAVVKAGYEVRKEVDGIVTLLKKYQADINRVIKDEYTYVTRAALKQDISLITNLVEEGKAELDPRIWTLLKWKEILEGDEKSKKVVLFLRCILPRIQVPKKIQLLFIGTVYNKILRNGMGLYRDLPNLNMARHKEMNQSVPLIIDLCNIINSFTPTVDKLSTDEMHNM
jgi:hypothetical protein